MIELNHVTKQYGNVKVVDDLTLSIGGNKVYGFLGPNGAGKSTTMNMITGYISATKGSISIDGHDIFLEPEKAKSLIGYLPEIPPVYPEMTPKEYLTFAAKVKGIRKMDIAAEVEQAMSKTNITSMKNHLIRHLSKGYRQRVGISCLLLGNPRYIIMDEPTVGLDPRQIVDIMNLIRDLGKEHTVILSSHILSEISEVCSEILILNHGTLIADNTAQELEKQITTHNTIDMTTKGSHDRLSAALSQIEEIQEFNITEIEDELFSVHIEVKAGFDIREQLFYTLADAKCAILETTTHDARLEDIFLDLTSDSTKEANHDSRV